MRVLFDNGTPRGLARLLNGELIEAAGRAGFELTRIAQNRASCPRPFAIANGELVTANTVAAVDAALPGSYVEVKVPFKD